MILQGRLNGKQHNRLKRLFDMMYKPSELAEEIGIDKNQIYRAYIPLGCPHERDQYKHFWINGKTFSEWYEATYKKLKLKSDEAYCKTCNNAVKIINPERKEKNGLIYTLSNCPNCNRKLTRIITQKRDNDKSRQLEAN
jgi:hypothetical protein